MEQKKVKMEEREKAKIVCILGPTSMVEKLLVADLVMPRKIMILDNKRSYFSVNFDENIGERPGNVPQFESLYSGKQFKRYELLNPAIRFIILSADLTCSGKSMFLPINHTFLWMIKFGVVYWTYTHMTEVESSSVGTRGGTCDLLKMVFHALLGKPPSTYIDPFWEGAYHGTRDETYIRADFGPMTLGMINDYIAYFSLAQFIRYAYKVGFEAYFWSVWLGRGPKYRREANSWQSLSGLPPDRDRARSKGWNSVFGLPPDRGRYVHMHYSLSEFVVDHNLEDKVFFVRGVNDEDRVRRTASVSRRSTRLDNYVT